MYGFSRYPEGWPDPEETSAVMFLVAFVIFIIVVVAMSIKDSFRDR